MCLHPNFTTNNPFSALVRARDLRRDYKNFADGSLQLYCLVRSLTNLPDSRRGGGPGGGGELWPGQQGAGRQPPPVQGDHRAARQNRAGAQPGHHTTIIFLPYIKKQHLGFIQTSLFYISANCSLLLSGGEWHCGGARGARVPAGAAQDHRPQRPVGLEPAAWHTAPNVLIPICYTRYKGPIHSQKNGYFFQF